MVIIECESPHAKMRIMTEKFTFTVIFLFYKDSWEWTGWKTLRRGNQKQRQHKDIK